MILANVIFDYIAIYQGIVVILFCIPIVLLCEFIVYRLIIPQQGITMAAITSIYANVVSGVIGIFTAESIDDVIIKIVGTSGFIYSATVLVTFFLLTCIIEYFAIMVVKNRLKISKGLICVILANVASYLLIYVVVILASKFMPGS